MHGWVIAGCCVLVGACGKKEAPKPGSGSGSSAVAQKPGSGSGMAIAPVPKPAPATPQKMRLVTTLDRTAQLIDIDRASAKPSATIQLPMSASALVWVDKDPIALLVASKIPDSTDDPKLDGTVGAITPAGFTALPRLPAATWTIPVEPGASRLGPYWKLIASERNEAWLGRCEWGGIEDGGHCDDWVWARLGGSFPLSSLAAPPDNGNWEWPKIAPAPKVAVTFGPRHAGSGSMLTCKAGQTTLARPDEDMSPGFDPQSLRWVSTDPPIFVADEIIDGFEPKPHLVAFEGCAESDAFPDPTAFPGPDGLFVLASKKTASIRRNGAQLASLPGADLVEFSPSAEPMTTSPFAILERQLEGDTSMFATDAIVLAPAPVAAAGVHLMPPHVKSVRIASFISDNVRDATYFACELQIVADGGSRTYRATELVDHGGHVVVAAFAPIAPLARVAVAPVMPSPTQPGPLADLLVHPRTAAASLAAGSVVVFGTDPGEHANDNAAAKTLLGGWGKLVLALDPSVREVHTDKWGYAIATVSLPKPGGALRMSALVIAGQDKGTWLVKSIQYLAL